MIKSDNSPIAWQWDKLYCGKIKDTNGVTIAGIYETDECDANARLIASAPELLSALQMCLSIFDGNPISSQQDAIASARSAIAKARGQ